MDDSSLSYISLEVPTVAGNWLSQLMSTGAEVIRRLISMPC